MTIYFLNRSKHIVLLRVDEDTPVILQPIATTPVEIKGADVHKITVQRDCESYVSKKIRMYNLVIQTEYLVSGVSNGEMFMITREKIRVSLNVSFDRFFLLATDIAILSETHKVLAERKMIRAFNQYWVAHFLFWGPFTNSPSFVIFLPILGIGVAHFWGWRAGAVCFLAGYFLLVALCWLIERFWRSVEKKALKAEDEGKELYIYLQNGFFNRYYSNDERTPFGGHVEND